MGILYVIYAGIKSGKFFNIFTKGFYLIEISISEIVQFVAKPISMLETCLPKKPSSFLPFLVSTNSLDARKKFPTAKKKCTKIPANSDLSIVHILNVMTS